MKFDQPVILVIIAIVVVVGVVAVILQKKKKLSRGTDFRAFFIIGITWIPLGIATDNIAFSALGVFFMIVGAANRKKWGQIQRWSDLTPEQKKTKLTLLLVFLLMLVVGMVILILIKKKVL